MMRSLTSLALLLTALFSLTLGALRLPPPANPIRAVFGDCAMPCWQGIQPGISSYDVTAARFAAIGWLPDSSFCRVLSSGCTDFRWWNPEPLDQWVGVHFSLDNIREMVVERPGLTLGEALLGLGVPDFADTIAAANSRGTLFTYYRAQWGSIAAQMRVDCPTTFAALLNQPLQIITLSGGAAGGIDSPTSTILNRSFRVVCRP